MDLFLLIILILAVVIIISLCGACCRVKKTPLAYYTSKSTLSYVTLVQQYSYIIILLSKAATVVTTVPASTSTSNTVPDMVPNIVPYPVQQNVMPLPAQGGALNIGIVGYPYPTNQPGIESFTSKRVICNLTIIFLHLGFMPGQVNPPYPQPVLVSGLSFYIIIIIGQRNVSTPR